MPSRPPASSWAPNPRGAGFAGGVGQGGLEGSHLRRGRGRSYSLTSHHHCPDHCFSLTCGILDPGTVQGRNGQGEAGLGLEPLFSVSWQVPHVSLPPPDHPSTMSFKKPPGHHSPCPRLLCLALGFQTWTLELGQPWIWTPFLSLINVILGFFSLPFLNLSFLTYKMGYRSQSCGVDVKFRAKSGLN